jgi:hypothetical protein
MKQGEPLFSPGPAASPAYCTLRDKATPEARKGNEFAEQLWTQYRPHADPHFLTEIRRDFHARFWEMYLTCTLLQQSQQHDFSVSCPKNRTGGPDICVEHRDLRIWIEAVTATDGDPTKADSVIQPPLDQGYIVPDEKIVLRYTTTIYKKHKKYLEYQNKGTVEENDAYVIAVNGFPLSYRGTNSKRILKAVFPIGPYGFTLHMGKVVGEGYQYRPTIYKDTGGGSPNRFIFQ